MGYSHWHLGGIKVGDTAYEPVIRVLIPTSFMVGELGTLRQSPWVVLKLQEVDKCLADGADEYLQVLSLGSTIMQQADVHN